MQERKIRHKKSWAGKCEKSQYGKRTEALLSIKRIIELLCNISSKLIENCCRRRGHRQTDRRTRGILSSVPCHALGERLNLVTWILCLCKLNCNLSNSQLSDWSRQDPYGCSLISEFCGVKLQQVRHKAIIRSILRMFEQIFINPDSVLSLRLLCKTHILSTPQPMLGPICTLYNITSEHNIEQILKFYRHVVGKKGQVSTQHNRYWKKQVISRDSNPGIPNPGIPAHFLNPESRDWRCFNLGISGLWKISKMSEFYIIFARKRTFSPNFEWVSGLDPNIHRFTGAIMLNKPFVRHSKLLYSISLDHRSVTLWQKTQI